MKIKFYLILSWCRTTFFYFKWQKGKWTNEKQKRNKKEANWEGWQGKWSEWMSVIEKEREIL